MVKDQETAGGEMLYLKLSDKRYASHKWHVHASRSVIIAAVH